MSALDDWFGPAVQRDDLLAAQVARILKRSTAIVIHDQSGRVMRRIPGQPMDQPVAGPVATMIKAWKEDGSLLQRMRHYKWQSALLLIVPN